MKYYVIPKYAYMRNTFLINNKYDIEIIDKNNKIEYNFVMYYLDKYKCKMICRLLEYNECNIKVKVKIRIISNENFIFEQDIDICIIESTGAGEHDIDVPFEIEKKTCNNLIPRKIMQTSKTNKTSIFELYSSCQSHIENNPDYEYVFYDDADICEFIKSKFEDDIFNLYLRIIPGAYKSDFFRYLYLYVYGGFYFDCKSASLTSISNYIDDTDEIILCKDRNFQTYYNAIIGVTPGNPFMKKVIDEMIFRLSQLMSSKNKKERDLILSKYGIYGFTGPSLLFDVAYEFEILPKLIFSCHTNMIHKISFISNKKKCLLTLRDAKLWGKFRHEKTQLLVPYFKNYYREYTKIYGILHSYKELFKSGKVIIYENNLLNS